MYQVEFKQASDQVFRVTSSSVIYADRLVLSLCFPIFIVFSAHFSHFWHVLHHLALPLFFSVSNIPYVIRLSLLYPLPESDRFSPSRAQSSQRQPGDQYYSVLSRIQPIWSEN